MVGKFYFYASRKKKANIHSIKKKIKIQENKKENTLAFARERFKKKATKTKKKATKIKKKATENKKKKEGCKKRK